MGLGGEFLVFNVEFLVELRVTGCGMLYARYEIRNCLTGIVVFNILVDEIYGLVV